MNRDLPSLEPLLNEIVAVLGGGEKRVLAAGDWPVGAIAFDGHHLLLVRDHQQFVTLSLPTEKSWPIRTRGDWRASQDEVRRAVASYRVRRTDAVSISDVIVALDPRRWDVSFPGTPVPAEAWITGREEPGGKIGLFQEDRHVNVVVWVGSQMRSRPIAARSDLPSFAAWVPPQLADQRKAAAAEAAEEARKKALPLPKLERVLDALRSGTRISTGGGRCFETYFMRGGKLFREDFDEGYTEVREVTVDDLRSSMKSYPDRFRESL